VPSSVDADASKSQASASQSTVNDALGGTFPPSIVTASAVLETEPRSSVTASDTAKVLFVAKVCAAVEPVAVAPSPKSHAYAAIEPSGSDDVVPSNVQAKPVQSNVSAAVGARFGTTTFALVVWVPPVPSVTVSATG
jgi:hypothetical protein